jgi:hypothetical protein
LPREKQDFFINFANGYAMIQGDLPAGIIFRDYALLPAG